ncbi:MAG: 3-dehydroquinate synthase [Bacteroidetes bacterium]|nr:3-dehydroquinate synthase [Bacteroidota bacterium]
MQKIPTAHYPIFTGSQSLSALPTLLKELNPSSVFILADSNTFQHCLPFFISETAMVDYPVCVVEAGERNKNWLSVEKVLSFLLNSPADRSSVVINLGGGMITDLGGFTASVYMRGIRFINIPTSLLGMVDASIGGKTGIDFHGLKNSVGTFSHPSAVILCPDFLKTLSEAERRSGFAEMIKHGFIAGGSHWEEINSLASLEGIGKSETNLISDSVLVKKKITEADFKEQSIRKSLNFGHTLGHAFESYALDEQIDLSHGEAVALGMLGEVFLCNKLASLPEGEAM